MATEPLKAVFDTVVYLQAALNPAGPAFAALELADAGRILPAVWLFAVRRGSPDPAVCRTGGLQPGTRRETCGPADGGAERPDGATHFVAPTSAWRGSTFTGTGRTRCMEMLRFLKFRQRSMPAWDFRFFAISRYLTTTNTREVGLVLDPVQQCRGFSPQNPRHFQWQWRSVVRGL